MTRSEPAAHCLECGHPFGPHVMFPLGEHAADGGVVVCNVANCDCAFPWSLDELPRPGLPDAETLDRLRRFAQTVHRWEESPA